MLEYFCGWTPAFGLLSPTYLNQRCEGEGFTNSPVYTVLLDHLLASVQNPDQARVELDTSWDRTYRLSYFQQDFLTGSRGGGVQKILSGLEIVMNMI